MAAYSQDRYPPNGHSGYGSGSPPVQSVYHPEDSPRGGGLPRSISTSDLRSLDSCREEVLKDYIQDPPRGGVNFFNLTPDFTLALSPQDPSLRQFVLEQLGDRVVQQNLEQESVLNWCSSATRLLPLKTQPDGNCLLHAASLGLWGFQDRSLALRRALNGAFRYMDNTLYQRWKCSREAENRKVELQLEPHQWQEEWEEMAHQSSPNFQHGKNLESLGDFHVFLLANVLRRPVILYASPKLRSIRGGGTLQDCNLQGVYLPLLWDPVVCKKNPLPLAYYGGHFSTLAVDTYSSAREGQFLLPLADHQGRSLDVKFMVSVEEPTSLIMDYLSPIQISHSTGDPATRRTIICTKLAVREATGSFKSLVSSFLDACSRAYASRGREKVVSSNPTYGNEDVGRGGGVTGGGASRGGGGGGQASSERIKCINSCGRYGDAEHHYLCPECFQKQMAGHENQLDQPTPPTGNQAGGGRRESATEHVNQFGSDSLAAGGGGGGGRGGGTSLGAVKCPNCSQPGFPQLMGMCNSCYNRNTGPIQQEQGRGGGGGGGGGGGAEPLYETLPNDGGGGGGGGMHRMMVGGGDEPPALPLPRNLKERSKCRKPGCDFYGTEEYRYYCSRCFETDMERILLEADDPLPSMYTRDSFSPVQGESGHLPRERPAGGGAGAGGGGGVDRPWSGGGGGGGGVGGGGGGHEPPKCYQCHQFYANEEFGGLCNGCFMKSTLPGASTPRIGGQAAGPGGGVGRMSTAPQAPRHQQQPEDQRRQHYQDPPHHHHHHQEPRPSYNPTAPQYRDRSNFGHADSDYPPPVPPTSSSPASSSPRVPPNLTAPVATLTSQMGGMSMKGDPQCVVCLGGKVDRGASHYSICAEHAADFFKMFTQGKREEEEVRSKPSPANRPGDQQQQQQQREFQYSQNPSYDARRNVSSPQGGRTDRQQQFGDPGRQQHAGHQYGDGQGQQYGNMQQQQQQQQQQYGNEVRPDRNERGYPPSGHEPPLYGNEEAFQEARRYGNEVYPQDYASQQQGTRPNDFGGDGRSHGGGHPPPTYQGGGAMGGASGGAMGGASGGTVGGASGGAIGGASGGAGGGASGGAEGRGGAVGGAGEAAGGDYHPVKKSLCANIGCSFKGYSGLYDLCPDCYKEKYPKATTDKHGNSLDDYLLL